MNPRKRVLKNIYNFKFETKEIKQLQQGIILFLTLN